MMLIKIIPPGKNKTILFQNSKQNKKFSASSKKIIFPINKKNLQKKIGNLVHNINNKFNVNIYQYLKTQYEDMDYDEAIRKDNRKFCRYYSDRLKDNHVLINTFCSYEPIKPKTIKITFFILQLDLYFFINGLFYDEEYISKIYHLEKDTFFTMAERFFDNLIYAALAGIVINYIIEFFFADEEKIRNIFKYEKDNILVLKNEIIKI